MKLGATICAVLLLAVVGTTEAKGVRHKPQPQPSAEETQREEERRVLWATEAGRAKESVQRSVKRQEVEQTCAGLRPWECVIWTLQHN